MYLYLSNTWARRLAISLKFWSGFIRSYCLKYDNPVYIKLQYIAIKNTWSDSPCKWGSLWSIRILIFVGDVSQPCWIYSVQNKIRLILIRTHIIDCYLLQLCDVIYGILKKEIKMHYPVYDFVLFSRTGLLPISFYQNNFLCMLWSESNKKNL